ncbi:hypothetical protein [Streptomyces shenzhenensis]|uniref:Uncharacterized protein n=1 Tax=Streptomyces shenzhenensis TaxID=943815 RepID=A0A3M0IE57_9ACTN|nr:hypothetical protein [Streptomyces shenzhenensis]RMB80106.1 hypothetical protein CTZ28_41905 [Streptomyces shenzhenensis]
MLIQATTMDPPAVRALRAVVPEITDTVTVIRRDFAARLREIAAGTSEPPSPDEHGDDLRRQCAEDFAQGEAQRDRQGHRDDAHLIADAFESAQARTDRDL